jgi:hypothetical protein
MKTGALVMLAPLLTGTFFGVHAVYGLLTGGLVSGVQMAISMRFFPFYFYCFVYLFIFFLLNNE